MLLASSIGLAPANAVVAAEPLNGLTLVQDQVLSDDGRLHELTLHSAALGRTNKVRVLLPAGYAGAAATARRYPMLLLLHGAGGDQRSWTVSSDVESHTAPLGLIVVMPDAGKNSFYSDWLDGPQWETHLLDELVPWVDATYRTVGTREGRAIAGLSMGGFGSMSYAARHPDRFVAAAAFSGAVDIADLGIVEAAALQALTLGDDRRWGPYLTEEANWRGHNPPDLATNLRWTSLRLATGNGVPCVGDNPPAGTLEAGVFSMNVGFSTRLSLGDVPHSIELRPCGTHEWHYWDHDLAAWLPTLMATFADPAPPPAAFDYRTTEPVAAVWGWSFTARRPATEFLVLQSVSPGGLTATGSGPVDVVTAPVYEAGSTYEIGGTTAGIVTVPAALVPPLATGPAGEAASAAAVAGADGRLAFTLDLGPAHVADQYSPEGIAAEAAGLASYFHTVAVSITKTAGFPPSGPRTRRSRAHRDPAGRFPPPAPRRPSGPSSAPRSGWPPTSVDWPTRRAAERERGQGEAGPRTGAAGSWIELTPRRRSGTSHPLVRVARECQRGARRRCARPDAAP